MLTVTRRETFNAAHRLYNPEWDEAKNQEVFGKCNNPNWHGHNYVLFVDVTGSIDPETGYVIDMKKLSTLIKSEVLEVFDHSNLNLDVPAMSGIIPTAENIAIVIWGLLRPHLSNDLKLEVRLHETEKNRVKYSGPNA